MLDKCLRNYYILEWNCYELFVLESVGPVRLAEMKKKVGANRVIFSYRPSYAAYGPFLTYDLPTGRLTRYRGEDPFVTTGSFLEDTDFLDAAFGIRRISENGEHRKNYGDETHPLHSS